MKIIFSVMTLLSFVTVFSACGGKGFTHKQRVVTAQTERASALSDANMEDLLQSLDEIAELERAGTWMQGMAITESTIRENIGDYAGAVAAAFKELAFAYGRGLIQKQDIEQGLLALLELKGDTSIITATNAIIAFSQEKWTQASSSLPFVFDTDEEPDSFANWMILVCALEKDPKDRRAGAVYRSIRARYAQFPEYWYRGARAFSGTVAAEFAEHCINSAPQGPYADECRKILASHTGLKNEEGLSLKTKREIETVIVQSINAGNPQILDSLLPLIDLPDNPYTIFAVGALRSLTGYPEFREYFSTQASSSRGRLAERLSYISRS